MGAYSGRMNKKNGGAHQLFLPFFHCHLAAFKDHPTTVISYVSLHLTMGVNNPDSPLVVMKLPPIFPGSSQSCYFRNVLSRKVVTDATLLCTCPSISSRGNG